MCRLILSDSRIFFDSFLGTIYFLVSMETKFPLREDTLTFLETHN